MPVDMGGAKTGAGSIPDNQYCLNYSGEHANCLFEIKLLIFTPEGFLIMGKYIGYAIIVFLILLFLEWFEIVDIPFLEIPDFTSGKKEMIYKTKEALD